MCILCEIRIYTRNRYQRPHCPVRRPCHLPRTWNILLKSANFCLHYDIFFLFYSTARKIIQEQLKFGFDSSNQSVWVASVQPLHLRGEGGTCSTGCLGVRGIFDTPLISVVDGPILKSFEVVRANTGRFDLVYRNASQVGN